MVIATAQAVKMRNAGRVRLATVDAQPAAVQIPSIANGFKEA